MNEEAHAKRRREAELDALTSNQLRDVLIAMGWDVGCRRNKAAYRNALLHLEKHPVAECIVRDLKLVKLEILPS